MKKVFTNMLIQKKSVGFLRWPAGIGLVVIANFLVRAQGEVSGTVKKKSGRSWLEAASPVMTSSNVVATDEGRHLTFLI